MPDIDRANLSAAFNAPKINVSSFQGLSKPIPPPLPQRQMPTRFTPSFERIQTQTSPQPTNTPTDIKPKFVIPNFSGNNVIKDPSLSKRNSRFKVMKELGAFKRYATRKAIADTLLNTKVLTRQKVRNRLNDLEKKGVINYDQLKTAKRKLGIFT